MKRLLMLLKTTLPIHGIPSLADEYPLDADHSEIDFFARHIAKITASISIGPLLLKRADNVYPLSA